MTSRTGLSWPRADVGTDQGTASCPAACRCPGASRVPMAEPPRRCCWGRRGPEACARRAVCWDTGPGSGTGWKTRKRSVGEIEVRTGRAGSSRRKDRGKGRALPENDAEVAGVIVVALRVA